MNILMKYKIIVMAVILSLTYSNLNAKNNYSSNALTGKWINEKEGIGMEIYRMHENFYGKIIWLQHPHDEYGNLKTDKKNPDKTLRNRPLIEINIIKSLIYKGEKKRGNGKFYAARIGKYAKCEIEQISSDSFILTVKMFFIKKQATWKKVKKFVKKNE